MKRTALVLSLVVVLAAAIALLLVDPFGWLGKRGGTSGAGPAEVTGEQELEAPQQDLVAAVESAAADSTERRAVQADPQVDEAVLRLVETSGVPVAKVVLRGLRDGELLFMQATDASGEVVLEADGGPAEVFAVGGHHAIATWTVRLDPGPHELRYPEGEHVAGRVVAEDGSSTAGLRLQLMADAPMLPDEEVPRASWETLRIEMAWARVLDVWTREDGSFAFSGLPAGWSGSLRLPRGWRLIAASAGVPDETARVLALERPVQGLVVRVAAPATITGRLLQRSDGAPLGGALLSARLQGDNAATQDSLQARTEEDGRFELVAGFRPIAGLELWLGGGFGKSHALLSLDAATLPPGGALGDVFVDDVRDIPFLLRRPDGEPIGGGRALAGGLKSDATGPDGRGVLRWVPLDAPQLRAEAAGYVPAEVELTPALPDPLVLVLERAVQLDVRLVAPEGGDPTQFRVLLRREEGVVAGPFGPQASKQGYVESWSFPPADLMRAPDSTFLIGKPSTEEGRVRFHALATGVPIELEVRGITGPAVYHRRTLEPFTVGERRRLEIQLGEGLVVFRGHVLDADGEPLDGASLQLDNQILGWTDAEGAFLCFLAEPTPGTLVLQHSDCSTRFLHDYVVPTDGHEVEFRLQAARKVTIEVVDEAGDPVPEAEVWILQEGFTSNTHRIVGNRHLASSLTDNPFQIQVRLAGRTFLQEHTSALSEARVVVPLHGSVLGHVPAASTAGRSGRIALILASMDEEDLTVVQADVACAPGPLEIGIGIVFPGRYQAWITYAPSDEELAAGVAPARSKAVLVTVEPQRRAEVELDLD